MDKILGLKYIRNSICLIKNNWFDFLFLFYQFVFFSRNVRQFNSDEFLVINLGLTIIICLIRKRLIIDKYFIFITLFYLFFSCLNSIAFGLYIKETIGFFIRLLSAYFIINYFRQNFFVFFETLLFILVYLSIPLYVLQIVTPTFFDFSINFSDLVLDKVIVEEADFRYILIFLINVWREGGLSLRNSGFMSEPAAFASVIIWGSIINLGLNNFKFNYKLVIFIIALITTVSIGGYIYLALLFFILSISSLHVTKQLIPMSIMFVCMIVLLFIFQDSDIFVQNRVMIETKLSSESENWKSIEQGLASTSDVSRISGAKIMIRDFVRNPFGYGFGYKENQYSGSSPNGLASLIYRFGVFFIVIYFASAYKYANYIVAGKTQRFLKLLVGCLLIISISGYSFTNQPLLWALILYTLIVPNEIILKQFGNNNKIQIYKDL